MLFLVQNQPMESKIGNFSMFASKYHGNDRLLLLMII